MRLPVSESGGGESAGPGHASRLVHLYRRLRCMWSCGRCRSSMTTNMWYTWNMFFDLGNIIREFQ
eukprot:6993549-Prorocentrum_lima.AAC.1